MALQIRRGTDNERRTLVASIGELIYTTDTKKVYIGDGTTLGGVPISGDLELKDLVDVNIASYAPIQLTLLSCTLAGELQLTTFDPHGLLVGQFVTLNASEHAYLNGTYEIVTVNDADTFTCDGPSSLVAESAENGTVTRESMP